MAGRAKTVQNPLQSSILKKLPQSGYTGTGYTYLCDRCVG